MAKVWSTFYPDVLPDLPGAPLPLVDHYLRNATIEFCERSKAWVADLTVIDAVAGQMEYALPLPTGAELVEIKAALYLGEAITPKTHDYLADKYGDWQVEVGYPAHYTHQTTDEVLLVPAPTDAATGALKIKAAVRPSPTAADVEDWFYSRYRLAIAAGCKALMASMTDKPWTNADRAVINAGMFDAAITKATQAAAGGFTNARPRFSGSFV